VDDKKDTYFSLQLVASFEEGQFQREVFHILDFLGLIGGILEIFIFCFEIIMKPIAEHAFTCAAIQNFYIINHSRNE